MVDIKVKELMEVEYDYGHFEEDEARKIVIEAIAKYEDDPELLQKILDDGTKAAREKSIKQIERVKKAMKIDY